MFLMEYTGYGWTNDLPRQETKKPAPREDEAKAPKSKVTKTKAVCSFLKNGTCSRTLMSVIDNEYGHPMTLEEKATDPLAGGLMQGDTAFGPRGQLVAHSDVGERPTRHHIMVTAP